MEFQLICLGIVHGIDFWRIVEYDKEWFCFMVVRSTIWHFASV